MPGLLERLAQVPDPRDPRGVRHTLAVVLALTACVVLAGATSLLAVGEWIADASPHVLEHFGVQPDPVLSRRLAPAEATVRRLLGRIDGDALDRGRRPPAPPVAGCAACPWNARIRRAVKTRGHFPNEQAALKCPYMAVMSLDPTGKGRARWAMRRKTALNAFGITFDGRLSAAHQ